MTAAQEIEFTNYLEKHKKLIYKVARVYCHDAEDLKDLIQDIIVQLWKAFPSYNDKYAFSTWTYRIALNVSISQLRKSTSKSKRLEEYLEQVEYLNIDEQHEDENLANLFKFIGLLKPIDKAVILLHLDGISNKEVAEITGFTVSNISTKKQRIIEELKGHFETLKN
ncbi:RNA polymerase sigma factor [Fulvivirga lutimaris]|uniref:RNA polymerase sigma factor n=1 Tax=Fulvivirga lutimaris TaxID=1819566 RepID=UPI0012BD648A|nr:sigma-70 family RNA polymerase sigma factor [Fulvivirga lutimaris]MTI41823.1 sigma-70 family RNA polymerase sigma factor [Fulvivirga lutimaris]